MSEYAVTPNNEIIITEITESIPSQQKGLTDVDNADAVTTMTTKTSITAFNNTVPTAPVTSAVTPTTTTLAETSNLQQPPESKDDKLSASDKYDEDFPSLSASAPAAAPAAPKPPVLSVRKTGIITDVLEFPASQQNRTKEFGNKAPTIDIVKRIKERTNTQIDMSTAMRTGMTTFLIKGKVEDVQRAKRELKTALAVKTELIIKVPASVRKHIFGPLGNTLKSITSRTGTRIQLPKRDNTEERVEGIDGEEEMMDIRIEGDKEGVGMAKTEIEAIVIEKTPKRVHKISHIQHYYYPLIAGAHNHRVQQIAHQTDTKIHIPTYVAALDAAENNESGQKDGHITVIGNAENVKQACEKIEDIYNELKVTTRTLTVDIPKRQHKYLIGSKGANLQEILEVTGCSLELAPVSDPNEVVTIRGPAAKLSEATKLVMDKASSINVEILDITNINGDKTENPLEHAKNVLKYLWNRGKLRKIEGDSGNLQIIVPKGGTLNNSVIFEFVGKSPDIVEKARKEVLELVKNLLPSYFATVAVDPALHRHIIGRKGQNLQRVKETYGVEIIVPGEKDESPDIIIVYEENSSQPADPEKKKEVLVKETLEQAKNELVKAAQDASDFATHSLTIPVKYHRHIIGPKGTTLNKITGGADAPVSVKFGSLRTGAAERSASAEGKRVANMQPSDDVVIIKGPTEEVERVVAEIERVVKDAEFIEARNSYTATFTLPSQYSAHIIGKGGATITRLKDMHNVKIEIDGPQKASSNDANTDNAKVNKRKDADKGPSSDEVKVTILGTERNVEEAKDKILDLIDKLKNETVLNLVIPAEYHKSLIGRNGVYVKRLEEKYGVHIRFPWNKTGDEDSNNNDGQKPNEVIIRGGKKGVKNASDEIMELFEYERDHNNSVSFTIPAKSLSYIVGRKGQRITEIKNDTFSRIDFGDPQPDPSSGEDIVEVKISGTLPDIQKARDIIQALVSDLGSQKTITMHIDQSYHGYLIGPSGSRIKEIVARANETENKYKPVQANVVKFPKPWEQSDEVILSGEAGLVERIQEQLEKLVLNRMVDVIQIPRAEHPSIIGRSGKSLKELQNHYNVEIYFPGSRSYDDVKPPSDWEERGISKEEMVKIIGQKEDIICAKAEIMSRMRHTLTVSIPLKYYRILSSNGSLRKIHYDFNIMVDHENLSESQRASVNGKPKRIDDDDEPAGEFDGELKIEVVEYGKEDEGEEVQLHLKGDKKQVEAAEKHLNNLLQEVSNTYTHAGYITIPQYFHRHIIGRDGVTITSIRSESGCLINVPKNNGQVVLMGTAESIEKARKRIQEIVSRAVKTN